MNQDMDYPQDNLTVLVDQDGNTPLTQRLTNADAVSATASLTQKMVVSRHPLSVEAFSISLNPLVAAASGLLLEVVQLKRSELRERLPVLNQRLKEQVRTFESLAGAGGVEAEQVRDAHYVLCTVVDEAVNTALKNNESEWSQMSLLSFFHKETSGGVKFFQLLDRRTKDPVKHLHLLELMYLCLALGFEGTYRIQADGPRELEGIRNALFRQIRHFRGDPSGDLSPRWEGLNTQPRNLVRIVPAWLVLLFTAITLCSLYGGFAWVLGERRDIALQPYQPFGPVAVQPQSSL